MARERTARRGVKRAVVVDIPDEGSEETEATTVASEAADETVAAVREDAAKLPYAIIYRQDAETGVERWLARVASSMVSEEWLAKKYGGGKYRVQHKKPNATGKYVFGGQDTYEIDPSIRPEVQTAPVMNADGSPAGGSRLDTIMEAGIMGLITQMQNQNQMALTSFQTMLESMREDRSSKGPGFLEIMQSLAPLLAPLLTALVTNMGNRKDPMEQAREIAQLISDAMGKNQNAPNAPLKDTIAAVKDILEVRDMLGGEGGAPPVDPGTRMLETIVPKLLDLATAAQRGELGDAGAGAVPPRVAVPAQTGTPQPAPKVDDTNMWKLLLRSSIPEVLGLARAGKDPTLYGEVTWDRIPEQYRGYVRELLAHENAFEMIMAEFPQLEPWREWCLEFFDTMSQFALPDEGGEDGDEEEEGSGEEEDDEEAADERPARTSRRPAAHESGITGRGAKRSTPREQPSGNGVAGHAATRGRRAKSRGEERLPSAPPIADGSATPNG